MIDVQTLVDNAIDANKDAFSDYKLREDYFVDAIKSAKKKQTKESFNSSAHGYFSRAMGIKETLERLFPDHAQYISEKLYLHYVKESMDNK